jgi:hypothetical protein
MEGLLKIKITNLNLSDKKIEILYSDRVIHCNKTKKTNLFFLFTPAIFFGPSLSLYTTFETLYYLTTDIIAEFKTVDNNLSKEENDNIATDEYIIYALYDIAITIQDFLLSLFDFEEHSEEYYSNTSDN